MFNVRMNQMEMSNRANRIEGRKSISIFISNHDNAMMSQIYLSF